MDEEAMWKGIYNQIQENKKNLEPTENEKMWVTFKIWSRGHSRYYRAIFIAHVLSIERTFLPDFS